MAACVTCNSMPRPVVSRCHEDARRRRRRSPRSSLYLVHAPLVVDAVVDERRPPQSAPRPRLSATTGTPPGEAPARARHQALARGAPRRSPSGSPAPTPPAVVPRTRAPAPPALPKATPRSVRSARAFKTTIGGHAGGDPDARRLLRPAPARRCQARSPCARTCALTGDPDIGTLIDADADRPMPARPAARRVRRLPALDAPDARAAAAGRGQRGQGDLPVHVQRRGQ